MKKYLAILLLLLSLNVSAQRQLNHIWDYVNADYIAWVKITQSEILDITGIYSIQKIKFEPIKVLKGETHPDSIFYAWLESQQIVWKEGSMYGFFLKKSTVKEANEPLDKAKWYWMENSGFVEDEMDIVASLSDRKILKENIPLLYSDQWEGAWVKAKIVSKPALSNVDENVLGFKCTLVLQEQSDFLAQKKGANVFITIYPDNYSSTSQSVEHFRIGEVYDFFIYRSDEGLEAKEEFIFK